MRTEKFLNKLPKWMASVAFLGGLLLMASCEDEFTEQDAIERQKEILEQKQQNEYDLVKLRDSLDKEKELAIEKLQDSLEAAGYKVNYSVNVSSAAQANSLTNVRKASSNKVNVVSGAEVTVNQGGQEMTATTNDQGVASFSQLAPGSAVVTVSAQNHTEITYRTDLATSSYIENVSTDVPLFPMTEQAGAAVISGEVMLETDATNNDPEMAEGAVVSATLELDSDFKNSYIYKSGSGAGDIEAISIEGRKKQTTVGSDGSYNLVVPAGNGQNDDGLEYTVGLKNIEDQRIQGSVTEEGMVVLDTMNVKYGDGYTSNNSSYDDNLPNVSVSIAAPPQSSGSGFQLDSKKMPTSLQGIIQTELVNQGSGYETSGGASTGNIEFVVSEGVDGNQATLKAHITNGKVDQLNGFDNDGVSLGDFASYLDKPTINTDSTLDGANPGSGAQINILFENPYKIYVANKGSGYVIKPEVGGSAKEYSGQDLIESNEPNQSLEAFNTDLWSADIDDDELLVLNDGSISPNYDQTNGDTLDITRGLATKPEIEVSTPTRERAIVNPTSISINSEGKITNIFGLTTQGAGYDPTNPPEVTIENVVGSAGQNAKAKANVNSSGNVTSITITNEGNGYDPQLNTNDQNPVNAHAENQNITPDSNLDWDINLGTGEAME